ncbi:MAG: sigma-70 family RNA polymerase sigma factor [Solirubrobacterales bacterium]
MLTGNDLTMLYDRHATQMVAGLTRRTFDPQIALDIVGETFAVAFEKRARFKGDPETGGRAWLNGIAANLLNDFYRAGQIEQRAMQKLGVPTRELESAEIERIEELAGTAAARGTVRAALGELSDEQRAAIELRVVEELPYPEVAAVLAVTEQVARARVSRGLRRLREFLDAAESGDEVLEHV